MYRHIMRNLPTQRNQINYPFNTCDVDFAGPFMVKDKKRRDTNHHKSFLYLFVSFVTKAVHLKLVSELSAAVFIMSVRRFIARRGIRGHIFSNNGTNFVSANKKTRRLLTIARSSTFNEFLSSNRITWYFMPPYSPHFGGLWEAGVRSAKHYIKRIASNASFTFEEMNTLLVQIEAGMNSRTVHLPSHPSDSNPLTKKDGVARVSSLRTSKGTIKRPIKKLCPLPSNDSSEDENKVGLVHKSRTKCN